ncbi:MAG: Adenine-specific DNA modification methylase [Candidatus Woesebacteria bacterium GW2011_GWC1_38_13]|uniref:Adenine-specific DNA modification methylase n=4 Tax=Candidatus Woeseibacteriota TaxID=1752722 RepID=A0A0G0LTF7_9BACT|nr:MAG: Adenine-specific DNA modification methylase [Candidatus Woesebacteria bacterium GW2011_GWD1_38_10]KKQ55866.1 MAG: Adenine-specific DNA modification methylase [Candidatus Woesebacteria bacterium GW2011_GWC1_38_13]
MNNKPLNTNLHKANIAKKDEFYTQLVDIEKELKHYKEQFRGKVVYCNCDDPYESNFFKYFAANFNALGLKKLITTTFDGSPVADQQLLFKDMKGLKPNGKEPFKIEIYEVPDKNNDGAIDLSDIEWLLKHDRNSSTPLKKDGHGDFRSDECIELLKEADIVVTNPPFSLFREYIAQLVEYNKKFLIIGNFNAITYKEFFKLIKNNKLWFGYNNGPKTYLVPDSYEQGNIYIGEDDKKYAKMGNTGWYTNLDIAKRHELLTLYKKYNQEEYPKYSNYDAIEVSNVSDIPIDYDGEIGVPVTFLEKYNPEQFEIIGSSSNLSRPIKTANGLVYRYKDRNGYMRQAANERFALPDGDTWRRIYDRIVIRKI